MTEFSTALSRAMERAGMSATDLEAELDAVGFQVSAPTLRAWRSGRAAPRRRSSLAAISALERILHVGRGTLSTTLDADLTSAVRGDRVYHELGAALNFQRMSWDMDETDSVEPVTMASRLIMTDPAAPVLVQRMFVTALDKPLERLPITLDVSAFLDQHARPDDEQERLARAFQCTGSRIERSAMLDRWRLTVEAVLDHPLQPGTTALLEHRLTELPRSGSESVRVRADRGWFAACCGSPTDSVLAQVFLPVSTMPRDVHVWARTPVGSMPSGRNGTKRGSDTELQAIAFNSPAASAAIDWRSHRLDSELPSPAPERTITAE